MKLDETEIVYREFFVFQHIDCLIIRTRNPLFGENKVVSVWGGLQGFSSNEKVLLYIKIHFQYENRLTKTLVFHKRINNRTKSS